MTIKNWTVVSERVKGGAGGLQTYQAYLTAKSHNNHKHTDILPITDNGAEFFAHSAKNAMQRDAENTKGGRRVASYAQGFNLTLPNEFQPSHAQWKMIFLKVRDELKKHLDCDNTCFYANIHHEPKKNSHMNLLVSRCHNGKVLDKLDQRSTIALTKNAFTKAVLDVCKISPSMYEKKSSKKQSKRLSTNAYNYKKQKDEDKANLEKKALASEIVNSSFAIASAKLLQAINAKNQIKDDVSSLVINVPTRENEIPVDRKLKMR
jgi:hypothetical protein